MTLNENIQDRLNNWKFTSAMRYLDSDVTENEEILMHALADTFGNIGEYRGNLSVIMGAAVARLLQGIPDDEED